MELEDEFKPLKKIKKCKDSLIREFLVNFIVKK
jgi:hypothetical protein